jgi:hypothetical protein
MSKERPPRTTEANLYTHPLQEDVDLIIDHAAQQRTPPIPEHQGEGNGNVHRLKRAGETRNPTDLGNAERFVDDHKRYARYCYKWNRWLVFDGTRWAIDDGGDVEHMMKKTVRGIYAEAAMETDEARRKQLADHARRSEGRKHQPTRSS